MFAEEITSSQLPISDTDHLEIRMTVRLEIPSPEYGPDVTIWLKYEPKVPEHLQDALHQSLYNGVHSGLYISRLAMPSGGVYVELQELAISSPTQTFSLDEQVELLGNLLEDKMKGTVTALFSVCGNAAGLARISGRRIPRRKSLRARQA